MRDDDLEWDASRWRNRPPGASDFVQELYMLLDEHPDGLTFDEIHKATAIGFGTDAYRAYAARLRTVPPASPPPEYGSDEHKRRAQRWWISGRLTSMRRAGTARREGDRWFSGERSPRVQGTGRRYEPLDATAQRSRIRAANAAHVRREQVKAELWRALNGKPGKDKLRELVQLAYDHLCGR